MIYHKKTSHFPVKSVHVSCWCNRSTFPALGFVNRLPAKFLFLCIFSTIRKGQKATDNEAFRAFIIFWNENECKHILWIIKHISHSTKKETREQLSCRASFTRYVWKNCEFHKKWLNSDFFCCALFDELNCCLFWSSTMQRAFFAGSKFCHESN